MINFYSAVIVYRTVQDTILVSKSLQDTIKTIQHNLCNAQILQRGVLESPFNTFHHMQPTVFSVYEQGTTKTDTHMTLVQSIDRVNAREYDQIMPYLVEADIMITWVFLRRS